MRRLSRGERNKGANLDIVRRRRESAIEMVVLDKNWWAHSSKLRPGSAAVATQYKPRIPTHIMAHKIQESAEGSKQAELRMEKKKPYWIYRSHRCARIFREPPFLYSRYSFFFFPVLYSLTRSLSWYLGNSYKSEKFSSRVSSGRGNDAWIMQVAKRHRMRLATMFYHCILVATAIGLFLN